MIDASDSRKPQALAPICVIVPCYNEVLRRDISKFGGFISGSSDVHLLFVDDGSTDGTLRWNAARFATIWAACLPPPRFDHAQAPDLRHPMLCEALPRSRGNPAGIR